MTTLDYYHIHTGFEEIIGKNEWITIEKDFKYIGKEYDGDLVYFYLEIENISKVSSIEITNRLLLKYFPNQQNLVKSKVGTKNKSVLLTKNNFNEILTYYN